MDDEKQLAEIEQAMIADKRKQADERGFADKYNTSLTPEEEVSFAEWVKALGKNDKKQRDHMMDLADYDMRGAFKEGLQPAGPEAGDNEGHLPDTYKKPSHPTFSNESMYHGVDGHEGGTWGKDAAGKDTFTPSPTNLKIFGLKNLTRYFAEREPNVTLTLPQRPNKLITTQVVTQPTIR